MAMITRLTLLENQRAVLHGAGDPFRWVFIMFTLMPPALITGTGRQLVGWTATAAELICARQPCNGRHCDSGAVVRISNNVNGIDTDERVVSHFGSYALCALWMRTPALPDFGTRRR